MKGLNDKGIEEFFFDHGVWGVAKVERLGTFVDDFSEKVVDFSPKVVDFSPKLVHFSPRVFGVRWEQAGGGFRNDDKCAKAPEVRSATSARER